MTDDDTARAARDDVGAMVANAVGSDRFWLFTHPRLRTPMVVHARGWSANWRGIARLSR